MERTRRLLTIIPWMPVAVLLSMAALVCGTATLHVACASAAAVDPVATSGPELAAPSENQPPPLSPTLADPRGASIPPRELPAQAASPMKVAEPADEHSEQMEQVARHADRLTRHGFELAGRGAYFAAQAEFLGALRLVAEGLDAEQETNVHCRALAAAMTAMREAEDFWPRESRLESEPDVAGRIAVHTTPVLKADAGRVNSMTALRSYFTFAQEQFAAAAGREVAGSMALHALGKLHEAFAIKRSGVEAAAGPKAIVCYQASLLVRPENFMAANDLGVLLARGGDYAGARRMLEHSLAAHPQTTTYRNLAVVYQQLGHATGADWAMRRAAALEQAEIARRSAAAAGAAVCWVDPGVFSRTSSGAAATTSGPTAVLASRTSTATQENAGRRSEVAPPRPVRPGTANPNPDKNSSQSQSRNQDPNRSAKEPQASGTRGASRYWTATPSAGAERLSWGSQSP